ncbi:AMP-binding protein, partial [bacterium]|nr:AMP-binding protein [bacterium]
MPIPSEPMGVVFDQAAARFADRPCLEFLGRRLTYREPGRLVDRAAAGFQALGVGPGVKVGLCLPNCPYYVIAYYGVLKAGGTVVNYNPLYVERELIHQIDDSRTTIMVTLDVKQIYPKIAAMLERSSLAKVVVCRMADILPTVKSWLFRTLKRSELADIPDDDRHVPWARLMANDGVLQYTGGTTGVPKGAMLTHANLVANQAQVMAWFVGARPGEERMLAVLPFFHVFAMTVALNVAVAAGAEIIMLPRFEVDQVLKTIARLRPTLVPGVPTMFKTVL